MIAYIFIDISITINALKNTGNSIISMLLIVPPIFILVGLFDVWIPREKVVQHLGEESGIKGMFLSFLLGALSAGPTIAAFPVAMIMMKKGAKYSNVMFFLMVWSTLKLPIVFYQITAIGWKLSTVMNATMFIVFLIGSVIVDKVFSKEEHKLLYEKAANFTSNK